MAVFREKLRLVERLTTTIPEEASSEEAALQAQRADITEIIRLMSQLSSFAEVLRRAEGEPAGKILISGPGGRARRTPSAQSQNIDITRESLVSRPRWRASASMSRTLNRDLNGREATGHDHRRNGLPGCGKSTLIRRP
jgi:hypothetical protein